MNIQKKIMLGPPKRKEEMCCLCGEVWQVVPDVY